MAAAASRFSLREIVARLGGEAIGEADTPLAGVGSLASAGPSQVSFLANPRYRPQLAASKAGAVIVGPADREATSRPRIVTLNPYAYYARTVALFHPAADARAGVHPSASIDPTARVAASAEVGAFVAIGPGTTVGEHCILGAHTVLGAGVSVGEFSRLHARVTVYDGCSIGARAILHSGCVIGADGFGMAPDKGRWVKIPQVGAVRLGDDVEIGANTTIDRGALDDTVVGDGVKMDNLVQVGHNCEIGAHTVIAGCVGIAGSVKVGQGCLIGGKAGITGHLEIAAGVTVSAMTLVTKSITKAGTYTSVPPMMPHDQWLKWAARIRRDPGGEK